MDMQLQVRASTGGGYGQWSGSVRARVFGDLSIESRDDDLRICVSCGWIGVNTQVERWHAVVTLAKCCYCCTVYPCRSRKISARTA